MQVSIGPWHHHSGNRYSTDAEGKKKLGSSAIPKYPGNWRRRPVEGRATYVIAETGLVEDRLGMQREQHRADRVSFGKKCG